MEEERWEEEGCRGKRRLLIDGRLFIHGRRGSFSVPPPLRKLPRFAEKRH